MEPRDISIVVIGENPARAAIIESGLRESGHDRVRVIREVSETARSIVAMAPDVVVIDLEHDDRDRIAHFFSLSRALQRPIAMFVGRSDSATIEAAVAAGVSAYVVDGLRKERVKPVLDMAISRFNAVARLTRELEQARGELENRKLIEKAKSVLMRTRGLDEAEAYALLRRTAMSQNRKIAEISLSLITASSLFEP